MRMFMASWSSNSFSVEVSARLKFDFMRAYVAVGPAAIFAQNARLVLEQPIGDDLVRDAELQRTLGTEHFVREEQLAGLAHAHQPGQEVARAKVTAKPDAS